MTAQLFGLDRDGKQVYQCHLPDSKPAKKVSREILKTMDHITKVIAVEAVPHVAQLDDSFHISFRTHFLFILERTLRRKSKWSVD